MINKAYENKIKFERLNTYQLEQVEIGLNEGLTEDDVMLYAKKEYSYDQMQEARTGLLQGLTREDVISFFRPDLPSDEMREERNRLTYMCHKNMTK